MVSTGPPTVRKSAEKSKNYATIQLLMRNANEQTRLRMAIFYFLKFGNAMNVTFTN